MNNPIEKLFKKATKASLTESERQVLRTHVLDFVREHPARVTESIPSPYAWTIFLRQHMMVTAIAIVCLISGASSALAQNALPGEPLYAVKTGVNEKVLGWFATTPEAKAEWQLSLADRRLEEIDTLSKEHKLTVETQSELEAKVDTHTALALGTSTTTLAEANTVAVLGTPAGMSSVRAIAPMLKAEASSTVTANATTIASTTAISADDIASLRQRIVSERHAIDSRKKDLEGRAEYIKRKAATLMAQSLTLKAETAKENGNEEDAAHLIIEAQTVLQKSDGSVPTPSGVESVNP